MRINTFLITVICAFCFSCKGTAQNLNISNQDLDKVFEEWKNASKPGVAAAIIKDGKVVYLKGFGSANIEAGTPITPQTKFQLGELSKQFTTLAILVLEAQGKITMNDDIRKYLTELPEYNYTVTIAHLLNHSSGFYDINKLSTLINGSENVSRQEEALKLIASQKRLSFKPGTDFSFHESVTESILMAEIVARSSGLSFADFVKGNIFEPLGMKNSLVRDDSSTIIANVAQPYLKEEESIVYKKNEVRSSVVGAINVYSSAEDLAKWYLNFTTPNGTLGKLVQKLDTPVELSNGKTFVYYWGEMAIGREFTHPERGLPIYWNFGFQGGYGSNVFRYIDQNITSFVLGNNNEYNGSLAQNAINLFVKDLYLLPENIDFKAKKIKKLSVKKLKTFEGHYWFKEGYASQLFVENDTLRSKWMFSKGSTTLVPLSDTTFQQYGTMEDVRLFKFKKNQEEMTLFFTYNESKPDIMERYEPLKLSVEDLQSFEGTYYNEEYASLFTFKIEGDLLVAKNLNHQTITFRPITKDVFTSTSMFFNALEFFRNKSNGIKGFSMVTDGIHNLEFIKIRNKQL